MEDTPQLGSQISSFTKDLSDDMASPQQGIGGRWDNFSVWVNKILSSGIQVAAEHFATEDFLGQRFQTFGACDCCQGLLFGFVGQVQIFQHLGIGGSLDLSFELIGQLSLNLDAFEDRLLPV